MSRTTRILQRCNIPCHPSVASCLLLFFLEGSSKMHDLQPNETCRSALCSHQWRRGHIDRQRGLFYKNSLNLMKLSDKEKRNTPSSPCFQEYQIGPNSSCRHPSIDAIAQAGISKVIDNVLKIHILDKIRRAVRDITIPVVILDRSRQGRSQTRYNMEIDLNSYGVV